MNSKELLEFAVERGLTVKNGKKHRKVYGSSGIVCILPHGKGDNWRNAKQAELAIRKARV